MDAMGIDIGNVIIDRQNEKTETSFFGDGYLEAASVPGAFEVIRRLSQKKFCQRIWLVSKCGIYVQQRVIAWLQLRRFHKFTGIPKDHVIFCRQRHEKAQICRELGITHFVGDRLEVLVEMRAVVPFRFLFDPRPEEIECFKKRMTNEKIVTTWDEILLSILS